MLLNWLRKFFLGECQQCKLLRETLNIERARLVELQQTLYRVTRIAPQPVATPVAPVGGFESIRRKRARLEREARAREAQQRGWREDSVRQKLEEEIGAGGTTTDGEVQAGGEAK